ncbi:hypothetical protein MLD52_22165 [Puniceicoccaceae bacterium K14]|nr:hypothetical protein [Puniceicoccaceae bacterium K14]
MNFTINPISILEIVKKTYKKLSDKRFPRRTKHFTNAAHETYYTPLDDKKVIPHEGYYFKTITFYAIQIYKRIKGDITKNDFREFSKLIQRTILFYNKQIISFKYTIESSLIEDDVLEGDSASLIIDKLLDKIFTKNRSDTILIIGKIGCGKSTLISSIINESIKKDKFPELRGILPISIDVRAEFYDIFEDILKRKTIPHNLIQDRLRERLFSLGRVDNIEFDPIS